MLAMHRISYISLLVCIVYVTDVLSQNQNQCTDHNNNCNFWTRHGMCHKQERHMREKCPLSCKFCEQPTQPGRTIVNPDFENQCTDHNNNCNFWTRHGMCHKQERHMREQCPLSCKFCEQPTQPGRTIVNPDFDCGRPHNLTNVANIRRPVRQVPPRSQSGGGASRKGNGNTAEFQTNIRVEDAICGATVIHPRFILTAAHCVLDPTRPISSVRLGELDFSQDDEANSRPVDYVIQSIIVHPHYDPNLVERYNDLALLKTEVQIEFNEVVYPYCLSPTRPLPNTVVTASGFGKINETSHTPILQEAELSIVDLATCESSYREKNLLGALRERYPNLLLGRDLLCAGHPGRGACEGDGGGPLYQELDGRTFLYGVVSVAMACKGSEVSNLPGIYVSVADHIDFIDSILYGF